MNALPAGKPPAFAPLVSLGGIDAEPHFSGALWIAAERALIVADLHLEKGSAFAERRVMLPPYDTAATLARLMAVVARFDPRLVVALGDSFHDRRAESRMAARDRAALRALTTGRDWIWIAGNHDPAPPRDVGGEAMAELRLGSVALRHEPGGALAGRSGDSRALPLFEGALPVGEIAGHLHPVARVWSESGSTRRKCFVADEARCVMPSFGAYTGGLNIRDAAFDGLFAGDPRAHALGRDRIYSVPLSRCAGD